MTFKDLGLSEDILEAVEKKGYTVPTPIQEKSIPLVLAGKDLMASAQTGTGKTAGFTLPILELLSKEGTPKNRPIRALILTPTRELAAQVFENVKEYSKNLDIKSTVIFGGVKANPQIRQLRNGIDILVATPGRLLDLHGQKVLSLSKVSVFVLDEADRMLDMGFSRDINRIMQLIPAKRQNLLFSATFSKEIKKLASGILTNPISVEAEPENSTAEMVVQKFYRVDQARKTAAIIKMISEGSWKQVLVFTRTKHGANKLCKKMVQNKISAAPIHGNRSQNQRIKALKEFKEGKVRILVATDIAARGLDIPLLPHVVNFELPNQPEDYIHRIGRTGRAGASGEAISFVAVDELEYLQSIEVLLDTQMDLGIIEGFEPDLSLKPTSKSKKRKPSGGGKRSFSNQKSYRPKRRR